MSQGSPNLRPRRGPAYNGAERASWEQDLLERLLRDVAPTPEEMELIDRALTRWGMEDPTPADILGMKPRAGLDSIMSLMAKSLRSVR